MKRINNKGDHSEYDQPNDIFGFIITFIFAYYSFSVSKKERNASIFLSLLFLSSYFVSLYFAY